VDVSRRETVAHLVHLARRFVESLAPSPVSEAESRWLDEVLTPSERHLFEGMALHDRRHALEVARRVDRALVGSRQRGRREWVVAALFHDVGKTESGLGIAGRVAATVLALGLGRDAVMAWAGAPGPKRRFGVYVDHPAIGARLILDAGGPPAAARWALVHQSTTADVPGMPERVRRALLDADDD